MNGRGSAKTIFLLIIFILSCLSQLKRRSKTCRSTYTYMGVNGINSLNLKTKHRISSLEAAVSRKT